jgi:hypothetical protein
MPKRSKAPEPSEPSEPTKPSEPSLPPPSKFAAYAQNGRGAVRVIFDYLHGAKRYNLTLEWASDIRQLAVQDHSQRKSVPGLLWKVSSGGAAEYLAEFIAKYVPQCPDPELLNEGLAKLSSEMPEGVHRGFLER